MRYVLIALAVLIVLVVAAVFVGPSLIPSLVYREQIAQAVEKATGRAFTIKGDVSVRVIPTVKARVEQASLANAPGGRAEDMAEIGRLDVGLALLPLLTRHIEINSFVLNDAVIHLEVDKSGKANWEFKNGASAEEVTSSAEPSAGSSTNELSELSLGDVRLVNGLITYDDLKSGDHYELTNINAKIALPSLDQPLMVNGDATYNGQTLQMGTQLAEPRAAIEGSTTALSAKVSGAPLSVNFDGEATFGDKLKLAGNTNLSVASMRKLSAWIGNPMPGEHGFGPLSISGQMSYTGDAFSFENADLKFDEIHATGSVRGTLSGKVPYIAASLTTDSLDLRPYIEESKKAAGSASTASDTAATSSGDGWNTEPIDVSALRAFNADMTFATDKIFIRDLTIGKSDLALTMKGGVLTANLKQLALYGGSGKGTVTLSAAGAQPQIASDLSLSDLDLASFMHDAAKTDRFSGTGAFNINVQGGGASQKQIVSSLAGDAAIDFKNGAIKGIDLGKVAGAVNTLLGKNQALDQTQAQSATDQAQGSGEETRFVAMGGTFAIANGIATTDDFKMINELISLTGHGSIDLPAQTMNFRVEPGRDANNNLKVALAITGPLSKPKIVPDPSGLIKNQLDKALGKLLGDKTDEPQDQSGETGATEKAPSPAQQLLQGILGGH